MTAKKKQKYFRRKQSGTFEVTLVSNYQSIIFWDDEDRKLFLSDFLNYGKPYGLVLHDFILEDTHPHLLLSTDDLSKMMASILRMFSKHYNLRHEKGGKIFQTPFYSYETVTDKQKIDASFYIFFNCISAGQVQDPSEYKWCSWKYHFRDDKSKVDTSLIDRYFRDITDFEDSFWKYCELRGRCRKARNEENRYVDVIDQCKAGDAPPSLGKPYSKSRGTVKNTDEQIIAYLTEILDGRKIADLSRQEIDDLAFRLFRETGASIRQVHSVLRIHFDHSKYLYEKLKRSGWSR